MDVETKLVKAKSNLIYDNPFFGALAVQLPVIDASNNPEINTMATDGKCIMYSLAFVAKLTLPELQFVLCHEILHCAFQHHTRRQERNPRKWNRAADYVINAELIASQMIMPKGGLYDHDFAGMSAEAVYNLIPDELDDEGQGFIDGGMCGGVIDAAPSHDKGALETASADWQIKVKQAAAAASNRGGGIGSLPAGIRLLIETLTKPKIDWRQVLRHFIDESACKDYSWMQPNRRFVGQGIILPSLIGNGINHIVIAVDTSGSINLQVLTEFASEINGAFGDGMIDKISVVWADSDVAHTQVFERGDELALEAAGGGGTAFSKTFEWIEANANDAAAIIYFTDLQVSDFGDKPHCPTIWAVHGDARDYQSLINRVPFGECVSLAA